MKPLEILSCWQGFADLASELKPRGLNKPRAGFPFQTKNARRFHVSRAPRGFSGWETWIRSGATGPGGGAGAPGALRRGGTRGRSSLRSRLGGLRSEV